MTEHVFDDLPQLLSGEADRGVVAAVAAHLRSCDDCRDELISALVAHAALTSAVRFAADLTISPETVPDRRRPAQRETPLPDLSAVFAQVRAESRSEITPIDRKPRRAVRYRLLAAAAVVVLAAAGGSIFLAERGNSNGPAARSVALAAYGQGSSLATAVLVGADQMRLDASALPQLGSGHYYEVWLTNAARTAMAPVGQLDAARKGAFTVPSAEMAGYGAIEVSVQTTASVGSYSGVSVLRGSYA
jgi:hypothetical protein